MRILVSWKKPALDYEIRTLVQGLENSHEVVYWIGYESQKKEVKNNSKAVFHDADLARLNIKSSEIDDTNFEPIDSDIIKASYKHESIVLSMMNRKFAGLSLDEKKHLYYELLQYWNGVLTSLKPEVIIFNCLPHSVFNYVLYSLANYHNIKILTFLDTWEADRMLVLDSIETPIFFDELVENNLNKGITEDDLSNELHFYYEAQINPNKDATPNYIKKQINDQKKSNVFLKKIKNKVLALNYLLSGQDKFKKIKDLLKSKTRRHPKEYLIKEYKNLEQNPNLNQNYVYFAVHFQPERTTCPQGEMYNDQILAIETLSHALPNGWKIYVKEHPMQWWLRGSNDSDRFLSVRYKGYYKKIARLKNVILVSPEFSTFKLIEKAKAISTITGTVGWESIMRQKPVMIFGNAWYKNFPKVFRIIGADSVKQAFFEIQNGFEVKKQDVLDYLYKVDQGSFHGFVDEFGEKNSLVPNEQNAEKVSKIIIEALKKYEK